MFSVVVATQDVVGERMAGPGIRAAHLAEEIGRHFPTTLIAQGSPTDAMRDASVLIGQPARGFRRRRRDQRIVYDLFDPVLLELREMYGRRPAPRERLHYLAERWRIRRALASGDLFLCATPQQRELYPSVAGRLIEVPFGVQQHVPLPPSREDIIVWGGGTWEWLDPDTAVRAVVALNREGLACRLLFLGRGRPNAALDDRGSHIDALVAAGTPYVDANADWVPYRDRFQTLSKCRIAIMLHHETVEARYAIRTRFFDALAAAIPVVATKGGFVAELIEKERLGIVVPADDVDAVAAAIRHLMIDDVFYRECVSNLERVRPAFDWGIVTRPLIETLQRWKLES